MKKILSLFQWLSFIICLPLFVWLAYAFFTAAFFSLSDDVSKKDLGFKFSLKSTNETVSLPNILLINTDDIGYGDIGCYGGTAIATPNIDRIAANGMRFTNHYTCNGICSPSRFGLMTGRYPVRGGFHSVLYPEDWSYMMKTKSKLAKLFKMLGVIDHGKECTVNGLPHKEITLAEALKQKGYATGIAGKWHLGDMKHKKEFNPRFHGFDDFLGINTTNDLLPVVLFDNYKLIRDNIHENQEDFSQIFADRAIQFIKKNGQKPFFYYLSFTAAHEILVPEPQFKGKSKAGPYGDVVEGMDYHVGRVLDTLEQLKLDDNTIVIFTSDNGPWYNGSTGGLRGGKGVAFEGGFKVPFLISWKKYIPQNSVSTARCINLDVFPTILSLAGLELPEDRIIDGKNISDLLLGKSKDSPHDKILFYQYEKVMAILTGHYKYYPNQPTHKWPIPLNNQGTLTYALVKEYSGNKSEMLFNLETDPNENYNVLVHEKGRALKMKNLIDSWVKDIEANTGGWKN